MITVVALHAVDPEKLAGVIAEMRTLGAPTVRTIEAGGYHFAVEGTHRLAAARELGLTPEIVALQPSDCPIDLDLDGDDRSWEWDELVDYVTDTRGGRHGEIYQYE